jgi:hypothetical protein
MTTRRWMIAVAVVAVASAIGLGLRRRSARFDRLADHHFALAGPSYPRPTGWELSGPAIFTPLGSWHFALARKYHRAARRPWLPVPPDPPEPE